MPDAPILTFTKSFDFSASHTAGGRVWGYNYRLHVSFDGPADEKAVAVAVEKAVIQKVHSRDLGLHVDFLKGIAVDGPELAKAFWSEIERSAHFTLRRLSLERDRHTCWTLEAFR